MERQRPAAVFVLVLSAEHLLEGNPVIVRHRNDVGMDFSRPGLSPGQRKKDSRRGRHFGLAEAESESAFTQPGNNQDNPVHNL